MFDWKCLDQPLGTAVFALGAVVPLNLVQQIYGDSRHPSFEAALPIPLT